AVYAAGPGTTILVKAGVFNESVEIPAGKDRLRIIGEGPSKTILDGTGTGTDTNGFFVESNFVTIAGFTVRDFTDDGIDIEANDCVIRNNKMTNNQDDGIEISGERNVVKDNTLSYNGDDGVDVL